MLLTSTLQGTACLVLAALVLAASTTPTAVAPQPRPGYYAYVCAESDDTVALVRFVPSGPGSGLMEVVKTIPVGIWPDEIEGPHGIDVHPDGGSWYVSLAHGNPNGSIHKFATGTDEFIDSVEVGLFPASLSISRATGFLYVVNFNLHGLMTPSSVSVVDVASMTEIAQVPTGVMPHGSRLGPKGTKQYSVSMMDDHLWEVDGLTLTVSRKLPLSEHAGHMATMDMSTDAGAAMMKSMKTELVQPTWVTPAPNGMLYVAGNNSNAIYEVDPVQWAVARTFDKTTAGPYNLDVSADGRTMVVTYKKSAAIGIWDLATGKELANLRTSRTIPHGVVISPDSKYAFVTLEGVGGQPGTVEVYDLATRTRAATSDIGPQAGGIAFWKVQ